VIPVMDELSGKTAVVTGAAGGIGYALCEAFAAEGMRVVMADVSPGRLQEAARKLEDATRAEVLAVPTDVTRWEDVERLAAKAADRFGAVQVLCNNAGVQQDGYAWEFSLEECAWILGVNLWGTIYGVKAFVPGMIERGEDAHVVNTASLGGLVTFPRISMYTAAKAAVIGLSEGLHNDLRDRGAPIGVSVLCPGPVMSGLREHSKALRPGGDEAGPIGMMTHVERTPASEVAAMVVDGIRADRFWILTHPEYNGLIDRRFRGIVETDEVVEASLLS
jgi:NAD(P)-dependent dehydrogenase (short-subunit alcohol dehydrogenase family)